MTSSTVNIASHDNLVAAKAHPRTRDEVGHRLLAVIAGGEEFLLRPEFIRGVYTIPADYMSHDLSRVPTPEGVIPAFSLAERMVTELGFRAEGHATERTIIVFSRGNRSVALRVHSVSRPIDIARQDCCPLPALAHPRVTDRFLDSVAVVHDQTSAANPRIALVINPLVLLGFDDQGSPLCGPLYGCAVPTINTDANQRDRQPTSQPSKSSSLASFSLLAFCPQTHLPAHLLFRFCLPVSMVAEVRFDEPYTILPTASSILRGFMMWRSRPVPVIDLARAFGASDEEPSPTQPGRILITRLSGGQFVALPTELNIQSLRVNNATSINYPAIAAYPSLGAFPDGSEMLVLPDLNRILNP